MLLCTWCDIGYIHDTAKMWLGKPSWEKPVKEINVVNSLLWHFFIYVTTEHFTCQEKTLELSGLRNHRLKYYIGSAYIYLDQISSQFHSNLAHHLDGIDLYNNLFLTSYEAGNKPVLSHCLINMNIFDSCP